MATTLEARQPACSAAPAMQHEMPQLPPEFPVKYDRESAWKGDDFAGRQAVFTYELTAEDIKEIEAGMDIFKGLSLNGDCVARSNFPLPQLGPQLEQLCRDVHTGRGFCVVRGIDPSLYSVEDLSLIYLGVQSYIAEDRGRQDCRGNMLVHIIADNTSQARKAHHRHSKDPIKFHMEESGDVVSWLTRATAAQGGKCIIASATNIYNVLAARRPDIVRTLARSDWPFSLPRYHCRPVIFNQQNELMINFGRAALLGSASHPRKARLPQVTSKQLEALNAIETIARATELEITTQPGDMHFINNRVILHRRDGFVNGDNDEKRHLVRMRLRSSQDRYRLSVPESLQREWYEAFDKPADKVWHLEPMPDAFFPLRKYAN